MASATAFIRVPAAWRGRRLPRPESEAQVDPPRPERLRRSRAQRARRRATGRVIAFSRISLGESCWLDLDQQQVVKDGLHVGLSRTEFFLLRALAEQMGQPVAAPELMRAAWGTERGVDRTLLYVFIRRLRKRLEDHPNRPASLITVHRIGYMLRPRRANGTGHGSLTSL